MPHNPKQLVLKRASERGIHLKTSKCWYFSKSLHFLGHQITTEGHRPSQNTHIKRFFGLVGYFRDHIKNMSNHTIHLRNSLKKGTKFVWSSKHKKISHFVTQCNFVPS